MLSGSYPKERMSRYDTMVKIRLVKHLEGMEQLVDLFRLCFSYDMSTEIWDWEYLQNPLASANPEVFVAMDNDKIVGGQATIWR